MPPLHPGLLCPPRTSQSWPFPRSGSFPAAPNSLGLSCGEHPASPCRLLPRSRLLPFQGLTTDSTTSFWLPPSLMWSVRVSILKDPRLQGTGHGPEGGSEAASTPTAVLSCAGIWLVSGACGLPACVPSPPCPSPPALSSGLPVANSSASLELPAPGPWGTLASGSLYHPLAPTCPVAPLPVSLSQNLPGTFSLLPCMRP